MKKKKLYKEKRRIVLIYLIIFFFICFIISIITVLKSTNDSKKNDAIMKYLDNNIKIEEVISKSHNIEIIKPDYELADDNPYWEYIDMNLINVDINDLKKENDNTVGWIQINGTNINYPIVQSDNNSFYLNHSFDKTKNTAGWIFMDYRNNTSKMDRNTIIYGHSRLDKTMFGSLKNILTNGWLKDDNNFIIRLSTEYENSLWQVFSVYKIPTTSDYLTTNFYSIEDFIKFSKKILDRSDYDFNTDVSLNDYILTLSTCSGNYNKLVVHAKLIKKETK